MKPYYYVFNSDSRGSPNYKHEIQTRAIEEAERLARKHPGTQFEVCKVIAFSKVNTTSTFWMDGEGPEPSV